MTRQPPMIRTLGSSPHGWWLFAAAIACREAPAPDGPHQASSAGGTLTGGAPPTAERGSAPLTHAVCTAAPGSPPSAAQQALQSQALAAAAQLLAPQVHEAHAAALGLRPWDSSSERMAGATYELTRYRLGPAPCAAEIQAVLAALNPMAQAAGGWTSSVRPPPSLQPAALATGLSAWRRREDEHRAVHQLAQTLAQLTKTNPSLTVLAIEGSGPTMRL